MQNGPGGFRADPEDAHARALGGLPRSMTEALNGLPGQLQPAISTAFASISASLSAAIRGLAASASAAASAIPAAGGGKTIQHASIIILDGRHLANVVTEHQVAEMETPSSTGRFDASMNSTPTD